jgi:hypothetical protein
MLKLTAKLTPHAQLAAILNPIFKLLIFIPYIMA